MSLVTKHRHLKSYELIGVAAPPQMIKLVTMMITYLWFEISGRALHRGAVRESGLQFTLLPHKRTPEMSNDI